LKEREAILHEPKSPSVVPFREDIQDRISPCALCFFIMTLQINDNQISNFWDLGSDATKKVSGIESLSF
jgi:hypothetical protein